MKKLLALVLALVMTLSLCVTSNAAYADAADIDYTEAVDVMSAIGVLQGDGTNFNPDGILTRAEACTIIAKMFGMADYAGTTNFVDAKGHWGEGAIAFCAGQGIVDGVGGGKFDPNGKLIGYAFAKMLLVALGYDAKIEGMTGSDWTIKVAKLIKSNELNDGIKSFVGSAEVSREVAAQLALNALNATEVQYDKSQNVNSNGSSSVTTQLQTSDVPGPGGTMELREDYFPLLTRTTGTSDTFGRPATQWRNNGKTIGTYANTTPDYVYTTAVKQAELAKTLGTVICGYTWTQCTNAAAPAGASAPAAAAGNFGSTANGTKTEIYIDSANARVRVVYTTEQIAQITKITKDAVTLGYGTYTPATGTWGNSVTVAKTSDFFAGLAAKTVKDFVSITLNATPAVVAVGEVTKNTGVCTKYVAADDTYTIGGESVVAAAGIANAPAVQAAALDYYTSADGYILFATGVAAPATTYLFVLDTSRDGTAKDGYTYNVKALMADGTTQWMAVSQLKSTMGNEFVTSDAAGALYKTTDANWATAWGNCASNTFYAYEELADGSYKISTLDTTKVTQGTTSANLPTTPSTSYASKTATNATAYVVKAGATFKAYTGYKNVPGATVTNAYILSSVGDNILKFVYVNNSTAAAASDYVLFLNTAEYTTTVSADKNNINTYDAIVNGEVTTISVLASESPAADTVYVGNTYAADGYISSLATGVTASDKVTLSAGAATNFNTAYAKVVVADASLNVKLVDGVLMLSSNGSNTNAVVVADGFKAMVYNSISGSAGEYSVNDLTLGTVANTDFGGSDYVLVVLDKDKQATTLIALDLA